MPRLPVLALTVLFSSLAHPAEIPRQLTESEVERMTDQEALAAVLRAANRTSGETLARIAAERIKDEALLASVLKEGHWHMNPGLVRTILERITDQQLLAQLAAAGIEKEQIIPRLKDQAILAQYVRSDSPTIRARAAKAITDEALLYSLYKKENFSFTRDAMAARLAEISSSRAVLAEIAASNAGFVREAVIKRMQALGLETTADLEARAIKDPNNDIRLEAARKITDPAAWKRITAAAPEGYSKAYARLQLIMANPLVRKNSGPLTVDFGVSESVKNYGAPADITGPGYGAPRQVVTHTVTITLLSASGTAVARKSFSFETARDEEMFGPNEGTKVKYALVDVDAVCEALLSAWPAEKLKEAAAGDEVLRASAERLLRR